MFLVEFFKLDQGRTQHHIHFRRGRPLNAWIYTRISLTIFQRAFLRMISELQSSNSTKIVEGGFQLLRGLRPVMNQHNRFEQNPTVHGGVILGGKFLLHFSQSWANRFTQNFGTSEGLN